MKRNFLTYILLCILLLGSAACQDDPLYNGGETGEGESLVSATVKFKPLTPALNGNTRTAGNVIKNINSLCVLLYNEKGELLKTYPLTEGTGEGQYQLEDKDRPDNNPDSNLPPAEAQTPHANFKLKIPYGRYRIYAVANMKDLLTNETYSKAIETADGLKSISLQWDKDEVANNNQMFGYFTVTGSEQNNEVAVINRASVNLHAWIRRAASKVTIAYDGSDLHENVFIYLKSVTIKDIPTECYLGKKSTINQNPNDDIEDYGGLIADGESITYAEGTSYDEHWTARITKGKPYYYYIDNDKKGVSVAKAEYDSKRADYAKLAHGETNEALFFYENMQGEGKDKRQDADGDKELDAPGLNNKPEDKFYKDQKPYGTYIEVKAYYVSNVDGRVGNGDIIYRFMLGKNITDNYDAERNHHYKLTLKFNKYANDVDWHIDYDKPTPSIDAPNPCYISYLYDKDMEMPVQINGELHKDSLVTARILTNDWYPYDAPSDMYYTPEAKNNTPWNGFLSLKNTEGRVNVGKPGDGYAYNINKDFYESKGRGYRQYNTKISDVPQGEASDGQYRVIKNEDGRIGITIIMPLYTRAKNLYADTGYTGNNPYPAYQRKATVEIKAILYDPNKHDYRPFYDTITVYQVRRIVNPKGVWRDWNETGKFYVQLTHLLQSVGTDIQNSANQFVTFVSQGPWSAEVVGSNTGWVRLTKGAKSREVGGKIYGDTGSEIEFYYEPTDKLSSADAEPRCAMIRIRYHNFSCEHTIFVRQGYAPLAVASGQKRWYSYNMRTQTERTQSPLEEGSMFKWRSWNIPINATNNKRGGVYGFNQNLWSSPLWIYPTNQGNEGAKWREIGRDAAQGGTWDNATIDGKSVQIATVDDYLALRNNENVFYGYGVLYGGTSDRVQMAVKDAYGYYYDDPETKTEKGTNGKGMRGVFVYNKTTGDQIFFPISASGYGRRRGKTIEGENTSVGKLRYANRFELYNIPADQIKCRPLFYRLYLSPGAIYWVNEKGDVDGTATYSWDMNYDSFNFNGFTTNSYDGGAVGVADGQSRGGSDACYVRCVTDTKTASPVRKKTKAAKRKNPAKLQRKFRK